VVLALEDDALAFDRERPDDVAAGGVPVPPDDVAAPRVDRVDGL
jgi:hypothetical protein